MHYDNPFKAEWPDLFYPQGEIDPKRLRQFSRWLRENRQTQVVLFHGTSKRLPIMEKGLLPTSSRRRKSLQSTPGYVYLSVFPSSARQFGEIAYPGHEIVVYNVTCFIRQLRTDKDQLFNRRMYSGLDVEDTLVNSLVYGFGARRKGAVHPFSLSVWSDRCELESSQAVK